MGILLQPFVYLRDALRNTMSLMISGVALVTATLIGPDAFTVIAGGARRFAAIWSAVVTAVELCEFKYKPLNKEKNSYEYICAESST